MRWLSVARLRFRSLFRPGTVDRELSEELRFHLEEEIAANLATGMPPAEARAAAQRSIGGVDQVTEACRDTRRVRPIEDFARDVAYALRAWRRNPGFFAVAVLTLAVGIGATTAMFSVLDGVVLRPLPYDHPDRIVSIGTRWLRSGQETPRLTGGDRLDLGADGRSFEAFSAHWGGEIGVQVAGTGEFAGVYWVEPAFFEVFGVKPSAGRVFRRGDADRCAVVGLAFAGRVFGDARRALGQALSVEGQAYSIVGVLPPGFDAPQRTDVWLPIPDPLPGVGLNRTAFNFRAVARLRAGVSVEQARARLDALAARLAAAYPGSNRDRGFSVTPLGDRLTAPVRATLWILMGAVVLVLVIACVNVANLLLARATTRAHEIALRAALGASRGRVVRQLGTESLVLAVAGGAVGVLVAGAATAGLLRFAPANLPRLGEVALDWRVLAFALACSIAASLLFGLAPAWYVSRVDLSAGVRQAAPRGTVGGRGARSRSLLVVAQIALSLVLATAAGLLLRSFAALNAAELGFRPDSVLVATLHAPARSREQYVRTAQMIDRLPDQLSSVPGVGAAAAAMGLPAGPYGSNGSFEIEGRPPRSGAEAPMEAGFRLVSTGYFGVLRVPLLAGREFTHADSHDGLPVAIVSRTLARRYFGREDPIGRRIRCGLDAPDTWMTIVGVVGDVRQGSPADAPEAELYMPLQQHPFHANEVQVAIRAGVDPASLVEPVRRTLRAADPAMALKFATFESMIASSIDTPRFRTWLVGAFAAFALVLAMAGVYGVMAYAAALRTAEFGVRVALGASRGRVFGLVARQAARLAAWGVALGVPLSVAAGRLVRTMLYGVTSADAPAYVAAAALLSAVVFAAAAIPAWQASRVDPVAALRRD